MTEGEKELKFRISRHVSWIPFVLFIVMTLVIVLQNAFSMVAMAAWGVIGLVITMFFAKDYGKYWDVVREGMGSRTATMIALIYVIVGIYGALMGFGKVAEGLVWLGSQIGLTGALFVVFTFIASAIFGVSTGTSLGTIVTMTVVLYPAGVILGANPIFLFGAILSGAAFGDNLAPVSDTTVVSASTQNYSRKSGVAEIGGVVKTRFKYAMIAVVIAVILYGIVGGGGATLPPAEAQEILEAHSNPLGLTMLIPIAILIYLAVSGKGIFLALTGGIVSAIVVGLSTGLLSVSSLFAIEAGEPLGSVSGAFVSGVEGMLAVIVLVLIFMGIMSVIERSGALDALVDGLLRKIGKSPRATETSLWGITTAFNWINAGATTNVCIMCGPIADKVGIRSKLHPYRRANILDATSNTWSYFIPIGVLMLIGLSVIAGLTAAYPFLTVPAPTDMFFAVFYCWALWIVMGFAAITGFGREFEGKGGKRIKGWFSNKVPEEALE